MKFLNFAVSMHKPHIHTIGSMSSKLLLPVGVPAMPVLIV